ncbi:hypothetical protein EX219_07200 [Bacillus aerophilus]|nr:hypothetical protein [Bacillus aerophilus]
MSETHPLRCVSAYRQTLHSLSVLRAGAHESFIHSAPVLVLPRLQRFSITLKRRQRAKTKFILALCQPSKADDRLLCYHLKLFVAPSAPKFKMLTLTSYAMSTS